MISSNSFSKKSFTTGSSLSRSGPTESTNSFSRKSRDKGNLVWSGQNTTSGAYGDDTLFTGTAFGLDPYFDGFVHFKNRTATSISH